MAGEITGNNKQLEQVLGKDIMTTELLTVYEGWSVKRLSEFFIKHGISGAPVIASDHTLVGVVTITDIIRFGSLPDSEKAKLIIDQVYPEYLGQSIDEETYSALANHADSNCTINAIMTPDVISIDQGTPLPQIARTMQNKKIRRIFVTKNGIIAGVISTGNVLEFIASGG